MPGYIHGLIQVEFSILVEDGVRTGRERGMSEGAGLPHSPRFPGTAPGLLPINASLMGTRPALAGPPTLQVE